MVNDYIRRQDVLKGQKTGTFANGICFEAKRCVPVEYIESLESANVVQVEELKAEIYKLKCQQDSKNQDYYTGYMSALSTVEGIIAEMGEE